MRREYVNLARAIPIRTRLVARSDRAGLDTLPEESGIEQGTETRCKDRETLRKRRGTTHGAGLFPASLAGLACAGYAMLASPCVGERPLIGSYWANFTNEGGRPFSRRLGAT